MQKLNDDILKAIRESVTAGVNNGMQIIWERIEEKEKQEEKYKRDRRLRNTKLLLRNYNNFKAHVDKSIYCSTELKENNLLEELDMELDETYVQAILKSKERTSIMLKQIDDLLEYYNYKCLMSQKEDIQRRAQIIKLLYTGEDVLNQEEVAEQLGVADRTLRYTLNTAIKELSVLFFGIEGLKT